jgi:hypothetical protein
MRIWHWLPYVLAGLATILVGWNLYTGHQVVGRQPPFPPDFAVLTPPVQPTREWFVPLDTHSLPSTTSTNAASSSSTKTAATTVGLDNAIARQQALPIVLSETNPVGTNSTLESTDDPNVLPDRVPTHTACDGYDGVYHIAMGDIGGAGGTIFFQFVLGQALYAHRHNLQPWVFLNNVSHIVYDPLVHGDPTVPGVSLTAQVGRNATYQYRPIRHRRDTYPGPPDADVPVQSQTLSFEGTGVWEHYFEPLSEFVPGDRSCVDKLYVTMDLYLITPGLHGFTSWAPRCWRYQYLPDYITKPHIPITEWLEPQRAMGHDAVQRFLKPRSYLLHAAHQANPDCSVRNACLGLHIRHSDKAAGRRVVATAEFLPYAQAFVHAGGQHVYVATDSTHVLQEIEQSWPASVRTRIRNMGNTVVRSSDEKAVFDIASHHRTNQEIIVEIYALSQCQFLVHGFSAVSESAIWINLDLHVQSVNLEDTERIQPPTFGTMVQMVLRGEEQSHLPRPMRTEEWWNTEGESTEPHRVVHTACDGYDGILHISAVGNDQSAGGAFFTSVLNQLIYAEQHNLKPWVHLDPNASTLVYDESVHNKTPPFAPFEMMRGIEIAVIEGPEMVSTRAGDGGNPPELYQMKQYYPGAPGLPENQTLKLLRMSFPGMGVWESYFLPVSDFVPGDVSCRVKPILTMNERMVDPGLISFSPQSVRAWQYNSVSDGLWNPDGKSMKDWYKSMREKGADLVKRYYRFQPHIVRKATEVNPVESGKPCLAVHLRKADKHGHHRAPVSTKRFLEYIRAFLDVGGRHVYIASDSHRAMQYVKKKLLLDDNTVIHSQGEYVVRSYKAWPAHFMESHHRVNSEALVDALAMSKCDLLLHGHSTLSEAAIYLNPLLHDRSVNLEDPDRVTPEEFGSMFKHILVETSVQSDVEEQRYAATEGDDVEGQGSVISIDLQGSLIVSTLSKRRCRTNAVIYLAQKTHSSYGRDSYGNLLMSLDLLHDNYLSINDHLDNTDIYIFHTGDFNSTDLQALEKRYGSSYQGALHLVDLSNSTFWARPSHNLNDDPTTWYAYPLFSEGYRRMMHWYAIDVWEFFAKWNKKTGCRYRYLFRLDEDSFIHSAIRYDIFDFVRSNNYVYGYRMCAYEMAVTRRMWTMWRNRHTKFVPQRQIKPELCGFYNNMFVADLEFFLSQDVQAFLQFIDRQGHIYRRRLGDLMIHSMAVYGFAEKNQIHRFLDFTYEHVTVNQTSGCLAWGGIQAGYDDPLAIDTLNTYYQSRLVDNGCAGNATFLYAEDLSPTYAHFSGTTRRKLPLYTITAGRIETPAMGILSG